jgi:hypothetical protein
MAKNRITLNMKAIEDYAEKLDKLGGDLKEVVEEALVKSNAFVAKNLLSATRKGNYPAGGKYSAGDTRHSITTSKHVEWEGTLAKIGVGFDFSVSGLKSIFLMYGTPKQPKVQAIYDAVYGSKTQKEIAKIQQEVFTNAIKKKMEG